MSSDALFSIYELLVDAWPSECIDQAPWLYFKRVSHRPVERLLIRSTTGKKVRYILRHLRRLGVVYGDLDALEECVKNAVQTRNRIAHMGYLLKPKKYMAVLNPAQTVHLAGIALKAAEEYISAVSYTFEEVNLGIATVPPDYGHPDWWSNEDWGNLSPAAPSGWARPPVLRSAVCRNRPLRARDTRGGFGRYAGPIAESRTTQISSAQSFPGAVYFADRKANQRGTRLR